MNAVVPKIYVVDDDPSVREGVGSLVRSAGFRVEAFGTAREALHRVQTERPSCMVLDVDLPGLSGLDLQVQMVNAHIPVPIIFLTGKGDIPMSVRAIKAGAVEFLTKPCIDDHLLQAIRQGIGLNLDIGEGVQSRQGEVIAEAVVGRRRRRTRNSPANEEIVGRSRGVLEMLDRVNKVAPTCSSVLITGETGTGKELVAHSIHNNSDRSQGPFIAVNCGAIPSSLIASELFGHEKGAFTGALQRRLGRFEQAHGGTIFLDEIGELSLDVQAALLRILQEREFERVGGTEIVSTDVRVIAATHRDLPAEIVNNKFRSDLFYRLNVYLIEVPPLRARREDIPALVNFFVERHSCSTGMAPRRVDPDSMKLLKAHPWPGNIRELQNVIERALIMCESETLVVDGSFLTLSVALKAKTQALNCTLLIQEKEMIEQALRESKGRVSGPWGAAAKLGLPPSTLESKILSLKIDKYQFKSTAPESSAGEVLVTV